MHSSPITDRKAHLTGPDDEQQIKDLLAQGRLEWCQLRRAQVRALFRCAPLMRFARRFTPGAFCQCADLRPRNLSQRILETLVVDAILAEDLEAHLITRERRADYGA